ncbi:hypothetical protein [Methanosphaerula palustris]|uniref:hypothetical protein n=1 Tax=Methanosphaerula palustris TaxID=475088 RepID=UPI000322E1B0|nr:hypothetical protein [Methanosphaerula palustris]
MKQNGDKLHQYYNRNEAFVVDRGRRRRMPGSPGGSPPSGLRGRPEQRRRNSDRGDGHLKRP